VAVLTPVESSLAGVADNLVAAAGGGDSFPNNGNTVFVVNNASGGSITVTFDDPNSQNPGQASQFNPDVAVAVGAGLRRTIGPFPPFRFNDVNGRVQVTYSGVTSLTVMALQIRS